MFDHVTIRVSDLAATERFYELVLATLGIEDPHRGEAGVEWNDFSISQAREEKPLTRGLRVAFYAPSRAHVDEFWRAGTEAGYRDDGAPGPRPQYTPDYYGGFLLDPDGNSAEAVHHGEPRTGGVDHLWIRVADVAASSRFYETVAPQTGFSLRTSDADRAQFQGESGSSSPSSPARPPSTSISPSRPVTTRRSRPSTALRPGPGTATTVLPASGPFTTPATTPPSYSTPTGITSRS